MSKKQYTKIFLALVFFYSYSYAAHSENFYTGRELLEHCENCINSANVSSVNACAYCFSNMSTMHDAFVYWGFMEPKWCLASDITFKELTKKTIAFIHQNPSSLHQYSTNLIADSLTKNYPCSE